MENSLFKAHQFLREIMKDGAVLGEYGAIYTDNRDVLEKIMREYPIEQNSYWKGQKDWSLSNVFSERYKKQKKMVDELFLPLLRKDQIVADVASANGEWALYISDYVKRVDGYEFSKRMVKTAKRRAKEQQKQNKAVFYHADACKVEYTEKYDHFMMMGLLTCFWDPKDIGEILKRAASAIKTGGYMVTKDTLSTREGGGMVYLYNCLTGYQAAYHTQEAYYAYFEEAGFKLEKEVLLDELETDGMPFISRGAIWKKGETA